MTDDFRIRELEKDVASLQKVAVKVPVLETKIENMGREIGELKLAVRDGFAEAKEDNKATRRSVMQFALTIAGSAIAVILTFVLTRGGV